MLRRTSFLAITTLMTLGATVAFAVDEPRVPGSPPTQNPRAKVGKGGVPILRRLDTNKDGQISRSEFDQAAARAAEKKPGKANGKAGGKLKARVFDRLDTDNSGTLSPAEIEKLKQLKSRKKGGR